MTREELSEKDIQGAIEMITEQYSSPVRIEKCRKCGETVLITKDKDGTDILLEPLATEVLTSEGYKKGGFVLHFANSCEATKDWKLGGNGHYKGRE